MPEGMSGVAKDFWPDDGLTQMGQRHESRSQSAAVPTFSWSHAGRGVRGLGVGGGGGLGGLAAGGGGA